jgi:hypothetical protein
MWASITVERASFAEALRQLTGVFLHIVGVAHSQRMPVYIVRWPREEVSLVRARYEQHLCRILDEIGDPGCACWAV